jgi:hypothetical protein
MTWLHRNQIVIPAPTTERAKWGGSTAPRGSLARQLYNEAHKAHQRAEHSPGWTNGAVADLWKRYRLTPEQWLEMIDVQCGRCALCRRPFHEKGPRGPFVDHIKGTYQIRGVLCHRCNTFLGTIFDYGRGVYDYTEHSRWFSSRSLER